ncbi:hypothetical protein H8B06_05990 [Sphingobacterium sp. DN00404]|uniref:Uncharacterized protein n=1 Tax=Sphingobacterium micropteri TaxID=2763501 RepID=A0ABR7YM19_9SPHI|nr:hypothetical protein [Sphingobacterium micropteri]MBD1432368.1 hypothetical protein [Sphingobacterium micropteri]
MKKTEKITQLLTNQFELDLFEASLAGLNDKSNKLRYNNFAYSIRELSRHFLHNLAPENRIKNCNWFKPETPNGKPSRNQRIKYAIQGGIDDELLEKWGFEVEELNENIKDVKDTIDILSKYTHINPEVFNIDEADVEINSQKVLKSFISLVETIENYREDIKTFLDGHIEEHVISSVISNFFNNVDQLAPHYTLGHSEVSDYHISEINDQEIIVTVRGDLYVILEYGSRQERREGDGLDLEESFPFETKIRYEISEDFPSERHEVDEYDVDTSSWYGDEEEDIIMPD